MGTRDLPPPPGVATPVPGRHQPMPRAPGSCGDRIRVLVADAQPIVMLGLETLLQRERDIDIVAACGDHEQVLRGVASTEPDIVMIDLHLPEVGGLEIARQIGDVPGLAIVLMASAASRQDTLEAVRLGVRGLVLKTMDAQSFVRCIRKVCAGGTWIETRSLHEAVDHLVRREAFHGELAHILTSRELDVTRLAVRGHSIGEIATELNISTGTIKTHLHKIYGKLKLSGRLELIFYAKGHDLV